MHYDVIIIGSGAGGGTLARRLAPSGKNILILERGDFLPREAENWDVRSVFVENRYISPDTWYDSHGKPFQPQVHYFVGGATKMYGAALYRLRKEDFEELSHYDGISPAWPVRYEEFEPYYTEAEEMYQVHGLRGADPTEPPSSAPYPYPHVSHEPRIQKLYDNLTKEGYHPFPAPCGVMLNEKERGFSQCVRCNTCDGFPCLVQAKSDAEMMGVRPALTFANVRLIRNAQVTRLNTNANGASVTEVIAEIDGEPVTFRGAIVVVSCGAANSAKLLLQSANERHPNGLANRSDQVGRNYMFHNSQAVLALSREPNLTRFQKTIALNDFYFGMEEFKYPMGNIQMIGKTMGQMFKGEKPMLTALAPNRMLDAIARHAVDFWLSTEDLPDPNNRITVDREGKLTLSYTPNNQIPAQKLYGKLKSMLNHLGMYSNCLIPHKAYLKTSIPIAGVGHQAGTCRFGHDPNTSVLDTNCKAHELDNLYVVDTSFFPSIGAVNPSLTAIANALRVGDHLIQRLQGIY
ncbi:MAG: GMC family oxidoreductase [Chlamydiales bacterium]